MTATLGVRDPSLSEVPYSKYAVPAAPPVFALPVRRNVTASD